MRTGTRRARALTAALTTLALAAGALAYTHFFTRGIDRLPDRPCGGAVDRALVASALPDARSASERGLLREGSNGFTFFCYVRTSGDSTISGEAETMDGDARSWRAYFAPKSREGDAVEVSSGDVRALSMAPHYATAYVSCTPPRGEQRGNALIVDARTIGPTRAKGDELRQVVVDFAYQLLRHAYEAGGCEEARDFPDALPRLTEGRVVEEPVG
ncbi:MULTISPECIES: hypothetical protein [Streptomyces]|uniref:hypothetical protein n=1 Tax=Streptomyces TaxID=1883 RepID=UPI002018B3FA|nr:hypothetical protein [Streptomyces fradiae]UQS28579.1 hypothetical protein J5J01_16050 [Streptomyces fradiae]